MSKTETGIEPMAILNGEFKLLLLPTNPIGETLLEQIANGEFEISVITEAYQIPGMGKNITKGIVLKRKEKEDLL